MIALKAFCRRTYLAFSILLFKAHRISLKWSRTVFVIFTLSTILVFTQMGKMKIIFSAEDLAGDNIPSVDELKDIKERYREGVTSNFILRPTQDDWLPSDLCLIRDWYSTLRVTIPEIKMTSSTFDFKWPVKIPGNRVVYRNILDLDCQQRIIHTPVETVYEQLNATPFGLAIDKKKPNSLTFQFIFNDSETSKFGSFDPNLVTYIRDSVQKNLMPKLKSVDVNWVGPADYQWYLLEGFKFARWVNFGMMILVLFSLRIFLGTWRSGLIYCSTLFITAIWVFGLKGLFNSPFDVLSTGLFLMIGISSLEDFVFISGEMMKGHSWKKSMRKILVPGCFTSFTTVIGFLSSCVSDLEAISRMGFWAAMGGLIECIVIFFFLPAALKTFSYKNKWVRANRFFDRLQSITTRTMSKRLAYGLCLVFPLGIIFMQEFNYNESPQNIFPATQEYRVSLDKMKESKNWIGTTSLLFAENVSYQEAEKILDKIKSDKWIQDFVVATESPQGIINWIEKLQVLPQNLAKTQFDIAPIKDVFVDENGLVRSLLYVKELSVDSIRTLKEKVNEICQQNCHLGGEAVAYSDFAGLVPRSLIESLITSLFFVSLVIIYLSLAMNKEKDILQILLSCYWGPFFMIMTLGFLHTTIDFWKSIFASILVGLAGDNAIQYIEGSRHKSLNQGIEDRGASSILTACLMAATSLCYLGSYFSSPKEFGVILFVGLLASLVGELWLLNSLLTSKAKE